MNISFPPHLFNVYLDSVSGQSTKDKSMILDEPFSKLKLRGHSNVLFSKLNAFYACRSSMQTLADKLDVDALALIEDINLIEPNGDNYDPNMRQMSLSGSVVESMGDLYESATVAKGKLKDILETVTTLAFGIADLKGLCY